jgi:hypothetical protein
MMHNTDYWIKKITRVINWCTQFNIISKSGPVENCFNWILGSTSKKKKRIPCKSVVFLYAEIFFKVILQCPFSYFFFPVLIDIKHCLKENIRILILIYILIIFFFLLGSTCILSLNL